MFAANAYEATTNGYGHAIKFLRIRQEFDQRRGPGTILTRGDGASEKQTR